LRRPAADRRQRLNAEPTYGMQALRIGFALTLALVLGCATSAQTQSPDALHAPVPAMSGLREKLDAVRALRARHSSHYYASELNRWDAEAIAGATREEVEIGLGEPDRGCPSCSPWTYLFYHLPAQSLGGGPELLLHFDRSGHVVHVDVSHTQ